MFKNTLRIGIRTEDEIRTFFNLSTEDVIFEECVQVSKDEMYPKRCLTFNTPSFMGAHQYVQLTISKDVPFFLSIEFHEKQRSTCPSIFDRNDYEYQYFVPRKQLYMRYIKYLIVYIFDHM